MFPLDVSEAQQSDAVESEYNMDWLAAPDSGTESLLGGEGSDICIGTAGRDLLVGGVV